jgi:hypothetical protein
MPPNNRRYKQLERARESKLLKTVEPDCTDTFKESSEAVDEILYCLSSDGEISENEIYSATCSFLKWKAGARGSQLRFVYTNNSND